MKVDDKVCCISCTCANIHQLLGVNENFSEKIAMVATVAAHTLHLWFGFVFIMTCCQSWLNAGMCALVEEWFSFQI